jgi:RNA polymerase sigma factor (sigma-70 family)
MDNPFSIQYPDHVDSELIQLAIKGDKKALQQLIIRHEIFVYNLALKMTRSRDDANDLMQEVFIKAITSLSKFEGKSRFRTWLYRITVNHYLNARKRKTEFLIADFETYFNGIDKMPDFELNHAEQESLRDSIEELRIACTAGMLMCLDRDQRIIYILGEMFRVDHNLGAEIMGINPGNFRVKLMRARTDLHNWMNKRCGLVNSANPCRCSKKTRSYVEKGAVDPSNLQFNRDFTKRVFEISERDSLNVEQSLDDISSRVFATHPVQKPVKSILVEELLNNDLLRAILKF